MRKNGNLKDGIRQRRGNMAGTLYRKNGQGNYLIRWSERDEITGKRKRVVESTHTADLIQAREILAKRAAELGFSSRRDQSHIEALLAAKRNIDNERDRMKREEAEREAAKVAKREAEEAAKREEQATAFEEAFVIYRCSKRRPDSGDSTLAGYEGQYQIFADWVKETHPEITRLKDFTPEMADEFIGHIENTRGRSTRNKYLIFLRGFWKVLRWEKDAQLAIDPWEGIKTLNKTADEVRHEAFTIDQLCSIAATINNAETIPANHIANIFSFQGCDIRSEIRALFAIGIFTGLRLGDCATLKWENIDRATMTLKCTPRKTARKYKRFVIIPLHRCLIGCLNEYSRNRDRHGYILPTLADMYLNKEPSMVTNRIQAVLKAAGIETKTDAPISGCKSRTAFGFHSLRHTFASIMLNAGIPYHMVEKMLGHAKESMTAHYYHENAAALAAAVSSLPLLPFNGDTAGIIDQSQHLAVINESENIAAFRNLLDKMSRRERIEAATILKSAIGE